jgi:hypothetical protein
MLIIVMFIYKKMRNQLVVFIASLFLGSCTKTEDKPAEKIISMAEMQELTITIPGGDTLKVNLGSFGDEEGAWIFKSPRNAKVSVVYRQVNSGVIWYKYFPKDHFAGRDTVGIISNRGSDGASPGINDTIKLCITVQ